MASMNPIEAFRLASNGFTAAGSILSAAEIGQGLGRAAVAASPEAKVPAARVKIAETGQEMPLHEDTLVLSDAMVKIFDGGKLALGAARQQDGKLDRTEFAIPSFNAIDLDQDGKLSQGEIYVMLDKATPEKRLELLQFLNQQGQQAQKVNNTIKWIARGVSATDIASVAAVFVLRFVFKVFSLPLSAIVSVVPPILAQFFGMKGVEQQIEKMNVLRDEIARKFDATVSSGS